MEPRRGAKELGVPGLHILNRQGLHADVGLNGPCTEVGGCRVMVFDKGGIKEV